MNFFKEIKQDLLKCIEDMSTIEHAFILNANGKLEVLLYRKQDIDGDSIVFHTSKELDPRVLRAFNEAFAASITSRTAILNAIIKIFKN